MEFVSDTPIGTTPTVMQVSPKAAVNEAANLGELDDLVPRIFDELRAMARRQLSREHERYTLQTTELVHEAYLRLAGDDGVTRRGRAYFYAAASRAMRQVLVDFARRKQAAKRDGDRVRITLNSADAVVELELDEMLALDSALDRLNEVDPRLGEVVEMRFFGGLAAAEIAQLLGVTQRTVERDWVKARLFLLRELQPRSSRGV